MTTMVTWIQANGEEITTRVYNAHLEMFRADVLSVDGYVMEMHEEM